MMLDKSMSFVYHIRQSYIEVSASILGTWFTHNLFVRGPEVGAEWREGLIIDLAKVFAFKITPVSCAGRLEEGSPLAVLGLTSYGCQLLMELSK